MWATIEESAAEVLVFSDFLVNSITLIQFLSQILISGLDRSIAVFVSLCLQLFNNVLVDISIQSACIRSDCDKLFIMARMTESCLHSYHLKAPIQWLAESLYIDKADSMMFLFDYIFGDWYHLTTCRWSNAVQVYDVIWEWCYHFLPLYKLVCWYRTHKKFDIRYCYFKSRNSFQIVSFLVFHIIFFVLSLRTRFSAMSIEFIKQPVFTLLLFASWYKVLTSLLRDNLRVCGTLTLHSTYTFFKFLMFRRSLFFGKLRWVKLPLTTTNRKM